MNPRKILLFDIDQTLLRRATPPVHGDSFGFALRTVFGLQDASISQISASGMIDPEILIKIAQFNGMPVDKAQELVPRGMKAMVSYYKEHCSAMRSDLMPGVIPILERLKSKGYVLGLLTGNIEDIGWDKLRRAGISDYFSFGAFGDMARTRVELVGIARGAAENMIGSPISLDKLVIVGDSVLDVACAQAAGIQCIAVGAGGTTYEQLLASKPDLTLHSLEESDQFMAFLESR